MSNESIESLRQAYMKENANIPEDCPLADQVSDYAFGELGAEEAGKVKEHLKACRFCIDLYMDIKVSEEDAEQAKDQKVEVLPGLQKAINKGKKPEASIWHKLGDAISDFLTGGFDFRQVATFATVVMVMVIGIYLPGCP
jgi:hypothetical protein